VAIKLLWWDSYKSVGQASTSPESKLHMIIVIIIIWINEMLVVNWQISPFIAQSSHKISCFQVFADCWILSRFMDHKFQGQEYKISPKQRLRCHGLACLIDWQLLCYGTDYSNTYNGVDFTTTPLLSLKVVANSYVSAQQWVLTEKIIIWKFKKKINYGKSWCIRFWPDKWLKPSLPVVSHLL